MKLVNVLLRDFIADVAPAPDQELSQGHAPMRMPTASLPFRFHAGGNSLRGPFSAVARPMFAGKDSAEKLPWRGLGLPRSAAPLAPTSFASAVQTCTTFFGRGGSQKCTIFYGKDPKATIDSLLQNFLGMAPRKKCWECLNFSFQKRLFVPVRKQRRPQGRR